MSNVEYTLASIKQRQGWLIHDRDGHRERAHALLAKYHDTESKLDPENPGACDKSRANWQKVEDELFASQRANIDYQGYDVTLSPSEITDCEKILDADIANLRQRKRELDNAPQPRFQRLRTFGSRFGQPQPKAETATDIEKQIAAKNDEKRALGVGYTETVNAFEIEKRALHETARKDYDAVRRIVGEVSEYEKNIGTLDRISALITKYADDLDFLNTNISHTPIPHLEEELTTRTLAEGCSPGIAGLAERNRSNFRLGRSEMQKILGKGLDGLSVGLSRYLKSNDLDNASDILFDIRAKDEKETLLGKARLFWFPEKKELGIENIRICQKGLGIGKIAARNILSLASAMGAERVTLLAGEENGPRFWAGCGIKLQEEGAETSTDMRGLSHDYYYGREAYNRAWSRVLEYTRAPDEVKTAILAETEKKETDLPPFIASLLHGHEKDAEYKELQRQFAENKFAGVFELSDTRQMEKVHAILHDGLSYDADKVTEALAKSGRMAARG